jgi:hypothetical protein
MTDRTAPQLAIRGAIGWECAMTLHMVMHAGYSATA